ncbi:MAG TPA: RNA polymerase sigma factor [Lacunisphaera sp.]|nr:RNA polymerase sigma factor [Lacunisphaera sp.]
MNAADLEALRSFYVESRQQLYTYAVSLTGNREAAEDAIQGVFEKLLRASALPAELRPYVFRSLRNAALDAWRRTKVRTDSIYAPESATAAGGPVGDFEELLRQLSDDEREVIILKIHGGHTFQQIADLRGVPLPTVASWYRRGLERLRALLKKEK